MATAAVDTGVPKAKVSAMDRDGWMTTDDEFARARDRGRRTTRVEEG
jgi:hypothetical protein